MPMESNRQGQDYSMYDNMSTEELIEILRKDFESDESSDLDAILYITEEVTRREQKQGISFPDPEDAWESFTHDYLPILGSGTTLYEETDIDRDVKNVLSCGIGSNPSALSNSSIVKPRPNRINIFKVAAAVIVVAFLGFVSAHAIGYNLWDKFFAWTEDLFLNSPSNLKELPEDSIPSQLKELETALKELGIANTVLPRYIPDGYTEVTLQSSERPHATTLRCTLMKDDVSLLLEYIIYQNSEYNSYYQKDEGNPEVYIVGDTSYFILSNTGVFYTTWTMDNVEGLIYGLDSREELLKIINSIEENYYD